MRVVFHDKFKKDYKKLKKGEQNRFDNRLKIFLENHFHPILKNHPLHGKYYGCHSINIGGDLRAIFEMPEKDVVYFMALDTHSKLYSG